MAMLDLGDSSGVHGDQEDLRMNGQSPKLAGENVMSRPGRKAAVGGRGLARLLAVVSVLVGLLSVGVVSAQAYTSSPVLNVAQQVYPTHLAPGGTGAISVLVSNLSRMATTDTVTATIELPAGVTATGWKDPFSGFAWNCPGIAGASTVTCTLVIGNSTTYGPEILAYQTALQLGILVSVAPGAGGVQKSVVSVSGGGASDDRSEVPLVINSAPAGFGVASFSGWATTADGAAAKQAGSHPDITTDIQFNTTQGSNGYSGVAEGNIKNISVDLPDGLVGDPSATPKCSREDITDHSKALCNAETQVGTVDFMLQNKAFPYPLVNEHLPVYNVDPPAGLPARFAFNVGGVVINIDASVGAGGKYNIKANVFGQSQSTTATGSKLTLWGVPADPVHDGLRVKPGATFPGTPSTAAPRAFLSAPTRCSGEALVTTMTAQSWKPGAAWLDPLSFSTDFDGNPITVEGCDRVPFDPSFVVRNESPATRGAPAGLGIELSIPQNSNPTGLASANLKKAVVTLPEGMVVNPSSAQGLEACSPAQIDLDGSSSPTCPNGSKIGSVEVRTPVLEEPLEGAVYLASQKQNPFGTTLAMYIAVEGSGVVIKLPGRIDPDPVTGRLTATFDDNPQLPFEELSMHLKTGPRAPVSLPTTCGPATTTAVLTPWSGTPPVTLTSSFDVSQDGNGVPCPPLGFAPIFTAGTNNAVGGADSAFTLGFSRTDDDQQFRGVSVTMPKGVLARISNVTQCDDAAATAGSCGLASKIGNVTTAAGAGSNPFSLPGRVYLTGPYKGAPFGLSIVVPAVAGPFNLGTVVVRAAINIDPIDAHVTVVSDPLPTILEGIPLQVRLVKVDVDRPNFIINPTSCAPKSVDGSLTSVAGQTAAVSARFQVGNCANLALKPDLSLSLSGKGQTIDGKHPAVSAVLTQKPGQANLRKVRVALPLSLALDPDNANGLCEFADGSKAEPTCPKASIVGTATAVTPILDQPLSGPVYFVKNIRKDLKTGREIKTLPKLVIPLTGQNGLKLTLTGTSNVEDEQLVTTFDNIPDAPVSSFKLNINGGKGGILTVSGTDICKATQIADQHINGQNNNNANTDVYIQTPSCPLKVLSKKVGKSSVAIKVGGLGAGKVTITGHGIKKTTKTISKSTVATITAKRTKGRPGKVTVSFDPTGPAKAHKTTK
jgi:hypothetical protein